MPRRRTIALASAVALLAVCVLAVLLAVGVTQTGTGQEWVRHTLLGVIAPRVHGRLYVGRISGSFLGGVTIDSVELRGPDDSLFVASGRIRLQYDVRDLIDRRVLLRNVEVEHPVVRIEQAESGEWNWKRIFPAGATPKKKGRGFGDYVVIDSATVRDAQLILTLPWHPADSLRGARRDSAVRVSLARTDAEIRRRGPQQFTRTWRWVDASAALSEGRLADPDSVGRYFAVARLDARETDPPFAWRNVRADIRHVGDSIWMDVSHWDLAGSTGTGKGKVVWGSGLPMRYDVRVVGDSVSLRDVAWVYPTLPRTGGGTMVLDIRNDPRDLRVIDYAISRMDVRTTQSRLRGNMTYGVGGPVLVLKDVALEATPVDFALLRVLNGKPFPYDWRGTITGTVRGRGGPLDRFMVDEARVTFADANVPGAVTRAVGRGELDVLLPAFTAFHSFKVDVGQLDLRTIEYLNPNFPPLGGIVRGRATLDSSWLDVRFRDADVFHVDGPGPPSHLTGAGRVTWGAKFLTYDLALDAKALSLTTLARSYPSLPLRGVVTGPIRAQGTAEDLQLTTTLTGEAGTVSFDGIVDAYEPSYAVRGRGSATGLDLRTLLGGDPRVPSTSLALRYEADASGSGVGDLAGMAALELDRSMFDGARLYGGAARVRFNEGHVLVDTLDVESTVGHLVAAGGLGLTPSHVDTLRVSATIDSLGGLRRWLATVRPDTTGAAVPVDSLAGALRVAATLVGTIDTTAASRGLTLDARLAGQGLVYGGTRAATLTAAARGADLLRTPVFSVSATADSVAVGTVQLAHAEGSFSADSIAPAPLVAAPVDATAVRRGGRALAAAAPLAGRVRAGRFAVRAGTDSGPSLAAVGRTTLAADSTVVVVDSARLGIASGRAYQLAAPARIVHRAAGTALDSLVLRGADGARVAVGGVIGDSVGARVALERLPLADLATLAGRDASGNQYTGRLDLLATVGGLRAAPRLDVTAQALDARVAGVPLERLTAEGHYLDRRLDASLGLSRGGAPLLDARVVVPVDLALQPVAQRLLADTLRGTVRADSLDLALLGAALPSVRDVAGRVRARVDLGGTWQHPFLTGALRLEGGAARVVPAGIRLQALAADVRLAGDTVQIQRVFAQSGGAGDTASLTGTMRFAPFGNPKLSLRLAAHNFLGIDRPRLATLWLSTPTPLTLTGSYLDATVRGAVRAERGRIYIPELIEKRIVDLNEYRDVVDTSVFRNRSLLPGAPSAFVENLTLDEVSVGMGDDVWLRSPEANIKLGGTLAVTRAVARGRTPGRSEAQLALLGALAVERGTYRLNLGPVQPVFEVQPGTLRFYGTPDLNPTLDIKAVHVVRQAGRFTNRPDVRVQVTIGGTLTSPSLALSSPNDPSISTTDLVSYLVTGEPASAVVGQQQGAGGTEQAIALGLRLVGGYVSSALAGGPFDVVQVQTGAVTPEAQTTSIFQSGRSILANTRIGVGAQLGERTFYSISTGLCGLNPQADQSAFSLFQNGLAFKVERRLTDLFSLEVGVEPGSQQQACGRTQSTILYQQTPRQFGIDLFRRWSF